MKKQNIYRVKNFFSAFFLFSIPFGGLCILLFQSIMRGMFLGFSAGFLFAVAIELFSMIMSNRMKKLREELNKKTSVIYDGAANHWQGREAVGGWLFLLEKEIFFTSHKINFKVHECKLEYKELENVQEGTKINSIYFKLKDGKIEEFIVNNRKEWIRIINMQIEKVSAKTT